MNETTAIETTSTTTTTAPIAPIATTVWVVKNFCDCRLCRGSKRADTPERAAAAAAIKSGSHYIWLTGGRSPEAIVAPFETVILEYSAAGKLSSITQSPNWGEWIAGKESKYSVIYEGKCSVQGCTKVNRRQRYVVGVHWKFYSSGPRPIKVIETD